MFNPPNLAVAFFKIHAPAQGVLHRARLLENFLEHEVRVLAALGVLRAEFELADLHGGRLGAQVLTCRIVRGVTVATS